MPFVTFTVRRGLSAADKSRLSEAMLEAQVAAGYHRADRFHRFLEVDHDDLLVDPRFPDYATDRTDRFMVVEVVISSGKPAATAANMADEAVRLFGERLHLAPEDILFVFHEVEPNLPRFPLRRSGERGPRMPDRLRLAPVTASRTIGSSGGPSPVKSRQGDVTTECPLPQEAGGLMGKD